MATTTPRAASYRAREETTTTETRAGGGGAGAGAGQETGVKGLYTAFFPAKESFAVGMFGAGTALVLGVVILIAAICSSIDYHKKEQQRKKCSDPIDQKKDVCIDNCHRLGGPLGGCIKQCELAAEVAENACPPKDHGTPAWLAVAYIVAIVIIVGSAAAAWAAFNRIMPVKIGGGAANGSDTRASESSSSYRTR